MPPAVTHAPPPTPATPRPPVPRVTTTPRRVLLRLPNWVGDVVMAEPTVAAVRRACPQAEIVAQVRSAFDGLAALLPGVDRVIVAGRDRTPRELAASRRRLRDEAFDVAVLFPRGARAMLAPRLAGIPVRVGYGARGHGLLLSHAVEGWAPWRRAHRSAFFGLLADAFGERVDGPPRLRTSAAGREEADALLRALGRRQDRRLVALEPGASYGPAKCWPLEHFAALARRLLDRDRDVLVVGTEEAADAEALLAARTGHRILQAVGRTPDLGVLASVLARADLLISNDTGPMHVAAALGTPVLALFGATDPVVSGPAGRGARRILWDPEPCSPCFLRTCVVPGHPCLTRIAVGRAEEEAEVLLAR